MSEHPAASYFVGAVAGDLFRLMCDEFLGEGSAREVYVFGPDPKFVLKFETKYASHQNVFEHDIWQWEKDTPFCQWFAPCHKLSGNGAILMQERNFGLLKGRIVAHDYGTSHITMTGLKSIRRDAAKLVKAEWW